MRSKLRKITEREEFIAFIGARHSPLDTNESAFGYYVRVEGNWFGDDGLWPADDHPFSAPEVIEKYMIFSRGGQDVACVNLTTLCVWASERAIAESTLDIERRLRATIANDIMTAGEEINMVLVTKSLVTVIDALVKHIADAVCEYRSNSEVDRGDGSATT